MASSCDPKTDGSCASTATSTFPMGTFTSDYQYVANSGDLDECNGRTGVTPEYPAGTADLGGGHILVGAALGRLENQFD